MVPELNDMTTLPYARPERGQSLVEFAMVVPLLLLVICGILEFGNILLTQIQLQNAVREGARYAALNGCTATDSGIQSKVRGYTNGLAISTSSSYNPSPCAQCATVAAGIPEVTVTGTYAYNAITPVGSLFKYFKGSFNNTVALSSTSTLNNEC